MTLFEYIQTKAVSQEEILSLALEIFDRFTNADVVRISAHYTTLFHITLDHAYHIESIQTNYDTSTDRYELAMILLYLHTYWQPSVPPVFSTVTERTWPQGKIVASLRNQMAIDWSIPLFAAAVTLLSLSEPPISHVRNVFNSFVRPGTPPSSPKPRGYALDEREMHRSW